MIAKVLYPKKQTTSNTINASENNIKDGILSGLEKYAQQSTGKKWNVFFKGVGIGDTQHAELLFEFQPQGVQTAFVFDFLKALVNFAIKNKSLVISFFSLVFTIVSYIKIKIGNTTITIGRENISIENPPDGGSGGGGGGNNDGDSGPNQPKQNMLPIVLFGILVFFWILKK